MLIKFRRHAQQQKQITIVCTIHVQKNIYMMFWTAQYKQFRMFRLATNLICIFYCYAVECSNLIAQQKFIMRTVAYV
jgi:hypothetical protein